MTYLEAYKFAKMLVKNSKKHVERANGSIFKRSTVEAKYKQSKRMIAMEKLIELIDKLSETGSLPLDEDVSKFIDQIENGMGEPQRPERKKKNEAR